MALHGPVSVLDSGRRESATVVRDKITRRQSPARYTSRSSMNDASIQSINGGGFIVDYRIPQPYRTSFSATHSVEKKVCRSRSLSPASTLRCAKKKVDRSRSKSPKRVTYDTRVTVRHSDTNDSMFAELSSQDCDHRELKMFDTSNRSADSGIDYSSQLRDISQQIYKMNWSPHNTLEKPGKNRHGILKDKQNSVMVTPPPSPVSYDGKPGSPPEINISNKENSPEIIVSHDGEKKRVVSKEYSYDRTISYRIAMQEQAGVKQPGGVEESPEENGVRKERSNTMPSQKLNSTQIQSLDKARLSPMKKSVSTSISNFFRKISPRMGRRHSKERPSRAGSAASGSSCSLTVSDGLSENRDPRFSRNKVRRSFLKMIGRSKSRSKSREPEQLSPGGDQDGVPFTYESLELNQSPNQSFPPSANRMMKSIEINSLSDKEVYSKFKERQSPRGSSEAGAKPLAVKPVQDPSANESGYNSSSVTVDSGHVSSNVTCLSESDRVKADPPRSLDVLPRQTVKALQSSIISSISGDESIGDCSLDINFTASEPSLLTKQPSEGSRVSSDGALKDPGSLNNVLTDCDKENAVPDIRSPSCVSDKSWELSPRRKPSYLRISCAVSGYGRYAQYSSYKNIEKRSPFSSTSSLRSIPTSPDMPSVHSPGGDHSIVQSAVVNGHGPQHSVILNGQVYPTGDHIKDGEYFLNATQLEEDRLLSLGGQADAELKEHIMSEEVSGRLRAAVGKGNLLVTKKFKQFRELCSQHMYPNTSEKETKLEDLQGYWDMVKIQIDNVDDMFAEIALMRQNGWKEIPRQMSSRRSSASSSPQSGSLSQGSTPNHTPGSKRKGLKSKDTPDSSPERIEKARVAAKARDDARKKLLAEKRAAMKREQPQANKEVEIYVSEDVN